MSKLLLSAACLLCGLAAVGAGGCAFVRYDKGAGPSSDPPAQAAPASTAQQSVLSSLSARVGGPGGGWIIAATPQNIEQVSVGSAQQANRMAEQQPAGPGDIEHSDNCDLNGDGFVTMDELLALKRAGLTDEQLTSRIHRTSQVFSMTDRQQQYLRDRGIAQSIIDLMLSDGGQPNRD